MNGLIISISNFVKNHITGKGWLCIMLLLLGSIVYYLEFFGFITATLLSVFVVTLMISMFVVGFLVLGEKPSFPYKELVFLVLLFSAIRYSYIYFFLSNNLPSYTLFHYPLRAIPITILGTAAIIFLGYSYAIYEWGLAAREKYAEMLENDEKRFDQPIKIRSSGKWVYLLSQDILYLKANGEYVDYHTLSNVYSCFQRLKQAEKEMEKHDFLRIHRSYIINPIFVESISSSEISLKNRILLPLSKNYKESLTEKMEKRLL